MVSQTNEEEASDRITKRTPVDIPPSAREVKAIFWEEPSRSKVLEIVRFVSETGKAHLHPDVTYTPIPPGSEIRYLEVFSLVDKFKYDEDNWCVCAACPHDLPQFKDGGIVCWFPTEGVIRIIGGDCYKSRDPQGHAAALRRYDADTKKRKDETYLLGALHVVAPLLGGLQNDLRIAEAFDKVRSDVLRVLNAFDIDLRAHVKDGKLKIEERTKQKTHGSSVTRTITHKTIYATIKGYRYLDPGLEKFSPRFQGLVQSLRGINFAPPFEERVLAMTDRERRSVATTLSTALKDIAKLHKDFNDARQLIGRETKATLRTWSALPNSTLPFYFEFTDTELRIGMSGLKNEAVQTPAMCYEPLSALPHLTGSKMR